MKHQVMEYDRRFQTKLIRALFQFPEEARQLVETLEPGAFSAPACQWVVRKLRWSWATLHAPATLLVLQTEMKREGKQRLLSDELSEQVARLLKKLDVVVKDKSYLFDTAHDFCRTSLVERFMLQHVETMQRTGRVDWGTYEKDLQKQLIFGARCDGDLGVRYFDTLEERIKRRSQAVEQGVPTGTILDSHMASGGLPRKTMGVVAAATGIGKTAALTCFGGAALQAGHNVLHVTCELDEDIMNARYDAHFSGISLSSLAKCPKKLRRTFEQVRTRAKMGQLTVKFWPPTMLTCSMLRSFLKRLEGTGFYPDLILLDYADLMSKSEFGGAKHSDREYEMIGALYTHLRGIAGEFNVPIWTATQTNRQAYAKKSIDCDDVADSMRKAHIADFMVAISQTTQDVGQQVARLHIIKNRFGPRDITHVVHFDAARVKIGDEQGS